MKKILIVMDSMRIGGIQKSLVNLLNTIDYKKYKIDLFLFNSNSKYEINDNVNVINSGWLLNSVSTSCKEARQMGLNCFIVRMIIAVLIKVFGANIIYKLIFCFEKKLSNYDAAISFSNNINCRSVYFGCNKFVLEKVDARKKITWLHTDYNIINNNYNSNEYKKFDKIVAVSNFGAKTLLDAVPELKDKVVVIYNNIIEDEINELAIEYDPFFKKNLFNIVSVGRLDINKNQIEQLKMIKRLKCEGYNNIKLYLIGDGPERINLENYIKENMLDKMVVITGYINNVLPYVKNSNLYISTSLVESYSMAILEALVVKTPTIVLNNDSCGEIIKEKYMIADNIEELYLKLKSILDNKKEYLKLKKMSYFKIENNNNLKKLYKMLDN